MHCLNPFFLEGIFIYVSPPNFSKFFRDLIRLGFLCEEIYILFQLLVDVENRH